jgi:hypothetical protein
MHDAPIYKFRCRFCTECFVKKMRLAHDRIYLVCIVLVLLLYFWVFLNVICSVATKTGNQGSEGPVTELEIGQGSYGKLWKGQGISL